MDPYEAREPLRHPLVAAILEEAEDPPEEIPLPDTRYSGVPFAKAA